MHPRHGCIKVQFAVPGGNNNRTFGLSNPEDFSETVNVVLMSSVFFFLSSVVRHFKTEYTRTQV